MCDAVQNGAERRPMPRVSLVLALEFVDDSINLGCHCRHSARRRGTAAL
jgi:hypothetical protein